MNLSKIMLKVALLGAMVAGLTRANIFAHNGYDRSQQESDQICKPEQINVEEITAFLEQNKVNPEVLDAYFDKIKAPDLQQGDAVNMFKDSNLTHLGKAFGWGSLYVLGTLITYEYSISGLAFLARAIKNFITLDTVCGQASLFNGMLGFHSLSYSDACISTVLSATGYGALGLLCLYVVYRHGPEATKYLRNAINHIKAMKS